MDPQPPITTQRRRHLISIADLDRAAVERILETADGFESVMQRDVKKVPTLRGRTVMNVFFESSTRTSSSFELAAKRLSADTMSLKASGSSVDKGESLKDTILTLSAYDPDVIVIRHPQIGAPTLVTRYTDAHVVNAGDGKHQHPTQSLLDLYTMRSELGRIEGLHVAIVGDVAHSRVARSNIQALTLMGAHVTLVGPPPLIPRGIAAMGVEVSHDIAAIETADVIYVLRMQRERMLEGANYVPSLREYTALWGVTPERVRPSQLVMHPGPMNRGVEIAPEVADAPNARIVDQVRSGLVVRMAVLYDLLNEPAPTQRRGRAAGGRRRAGGGLMERLFRRDAPPANLVIRGARLFDRGAGLEGTQLDVRIADGGIAEIGERLDGGGVEEIDAAGLTMTPGLVDPHVHLRTPGRRGRGGHRVGHAGRRRRRLRRHPGDAQHRAGGRLGDAARRSDRAGARAGRRAHRLLRRHHPRPGGSRAGRHGRAGGAAARPGSPTTAGRWSGRRCCAARSSTRASPASS